MSYVILTDAACDLYAGLCGQSETGFIPMEYSLGNEMRSCVPPEAPETMKLFYNGQRKGELTRTSQISPMEYETAMVPWLEKGYSILYLALSSGLSSTYNTACMTAGQLLERYPGLEIVCVDTLSATGGMGILMERAMRNRTQGLSLHENASDLNEAIRHIRHWFLVQDLMYLQRGGRVSMAAAAMGTVLHIHPILKIDPIGKLQTIGKERGVHKAIRTLMDHYTESSDPSSSDPVYVLDADAPDTGDALEEKLLAFNPDLTIRRCTLSPVIGAHTGPGMAAIVHIGK